MSTSTPSTHDATHSGLRSSVGFETITESVRATSFYAAVALPLVHVPLLLSGLTTIPEMGAFALLLIVNLVALVAGHGYEPDA